MRRFIVLVAGLALAGSVAAFALGAGGQRDIPKLGDVITGNDLGFRVEKVGSNRVVGRFVVRVNGEWTDAEPPALPPVMPAKP